jgi:Luciferase-like monooxygenase
VEGIGRELAMKRLRRIIRRARRRVIAIRTRVRSMEFGASIFFTDHSISPAELAVAPEQRGFDALWGAEHSHIPASRRTPTPGGGELVKRYYDVMDPFVTLTAAAAATKRLKVGIGVCLSSSATRSRPPSSSPRSTRSRAGVSCSASAAEATAACTFLTHECIFTRDSHSR